MSEETTPEQSEPEPQLEPLPSSLQEAVGDLLSEGYLREGTPELITTPEQVIALLTRLARELPQPYERLVDLCGVDWPDHLQVVYHLYHGYTAESVVVKVNLPRTGAQAPTVTNLWGLAGWPEREVAELFGITFTNHPDPRPLLLPDDFQGHPLRKDYQYDHESPYLSPDPLREDPISALQAESDQESNPARDEL